MRGWLILMVEHARFCKIEPAKSTRRHGDEGGPGTKSSGEGRGEGGLLGKEVDICWGKVIDQQNQRNYVRKK